MRIWEVGSESLWLDEGISAMFATPSLPTLLRTLIERDLHPPLYYVLLHGWMYVAGVTEYSVRMPTVLIGSATIALLYRFARDLYRSHSGAAAIALLAAIQVALSPFLVYYSREARMYGPLVALSILATLSLWRATLQPGRRSRWAFYALAAVLVPYTHLFGWLVLLTHAAFVIVAANRRVIRPYLGAAVAIGVLYGPWVWPSVLQITRLQTTPDFWQGTVSLWFVVSHAFTGILVGFGGGLDRRGPLQALFVATFGVGVVLAVWRALRRREPADTLVVLSVVIPVAVIYAIVATNPKFADRYLIVVVPAFSILIARAIVALAGTRQRGTRFLHITIGAARLAMGALVALTVIAVMARETLRIYSDDAYRKDQNRDAVDFLIGNWQSSDAAILLIDWSPVFDFYAHGLLTRYGFGPTDDTQFVARSLNEILDVGHKRLWVAFWNPEWADPTGTIREMLDETLVAVPFPDPRPRGLTLRLYGVEDGARFDGATVPSRLEPLSFVDGLDLLGFDLPRELAVTDGERVRGRAYWRLVQPTTRDFGISVRLVGSGQEWARTDQRLAAFTHPTSVWLPARIVRGRFEIEIPPGAPPGDYDLEARAYDRADGRELLATGAFTSRPLLVARLNVARRAPPSIVPATGACPGTNLGSLRLVCFDGAPDHARPGGAVTATLSWSRNIGVPAMDGPVTIGLTDSSGATWPLSTSSPGGPKFPTSTWLADDVVLDRRLLRFPAGIAAGVGSLYVSAVGVERTLGPITIELIRRVNSSPLPDEAFRFRVGAFASMAAVDTSNTVRALGTVRTRLVWRARADGVGDARVFVHVAREDGRPVAQVDRVPGNGSRPTSSWLAGEFITDEIEIALEASVQSGVYRLRAGLYDSTTEQRLVVTTIDGVSDAAEIGEIRVLP